MSRDPAAPSGRLLKLLSEVCQEASETYPDISLYLVGYLNGDRRPILRLPCPRPRPIADGDTNRDLILQTLGESDHPLTVVELSYRAKGEEPTGAFRKALKQLVTCGTVREHPGPPRTYEEK